MSSVCVVENQAGGQRSFYMRNFENERDVLMGNSLASVTESRPEALSSLLVRANNTSASVLLLQIYRRSQTYEPLCL